MSNFTLIRGTGHTAVIRGTDKYGLYGSQVVDTTVWDRLVEAHEMLDKAEAADEAIAEFFAPLRQALESLDSEDEAVEDPLNPVKVLEEGTPHQHATEAVVIELDHDGVLIDAVTQGLFDRLAWVEGRLFVEAMPDSDA